MRGIDCRCSLGLFGNRWWMAGSPLSSSLPEVRNSMSLRTWRSPRVTWWVGSTLSPLCRQSKAFLIGTTCLCGAVLYNMSWSTTIRNFENFQGLPCFLKTFTCTNTKMWKNPFTTRTLKSMHLSHLHTSICSLTWGCCFFFGHQVPAALLTFAWDAAVQADIAAAGGASPTLLKPELLESIRTMCWAPSRSVETPAYPHLPLLTFVPPLMALWLAWSCPCKKTKNKKKIANKFIFHKFCKTVQEQWQAGWGQLHPAHSVLPSCPHKDRARFFLLKETTSVIFCCTPSDYSYRVVNGRQHPRCVLLPAVLTVKLCCTFAACWEISL